MERAEIKAVADYLKDLEEGLYEWDYRGIMIQGHLTKLYEIIRELMDGTFVDPGGDANTDAHAAAGKIDGALIFDGNDEHISCGTGPAITGTGTFSVSAWVKTDSTKGHGMVTQRSSSTANGSYGFSVRADGRAQFYVYDDNDHGFLIQSSVTVDDGLWHHIVGVRTNSTDGEIYVDGSLVASGTGTARSLDSVPVWIGGLGWTSPYNLDGTIDDVQIFDRALSVTEIGWLYGLSYDKNGNLASDGLLKYYYDCENRLTEVSDANDDAVASYRYDFAGRRISKTVSGVTTKYVYDGDQVIAEYNGNDTLLRKFVYGPGIDEPVCMIDVADGNAIYYYHYDGLGSVVALSDVNSVVVERYSYDVFGEVEIRDSNNSVVSVSSVANPYMFTGRRFDTETGLYYYRFRYYSTELGRFLQTDPIGYYYSMNLYEYCRNNPIMWVDPYGLLSAWGMIAGEWDWEPTSDQREELKSAFLEGLDDGHALTSNGVAFWQHLEPKERRRLMRRYGKVGRRSEYCGATATVCVAAAGGIAAADMDRDISGTGSDKCPKPSEEKPPTEYRHDTPPSRPKYDKKTKKHEPDHWHFRDWDWSPEKKKWFPKWKYYGPNRPPDAPPGM